MIGVDAEGAEVVGGARRSARGDKALQMPTARGLPLVGVLPWLVSRRLEFFAKQRERLGDIYRIDLGMVDIVVLNQPRHVDHILRSNYRNYDKSGPLWRSIRSLVGNGLSTAEGEAWRRKRRQIQPEFSHAKLPILAQRMSESIDKSLLEWEESERSGQPVDVAQLMSRLTMRVVVNTLFGGSLTNADADTVSQAMVTIVDHIFSGVVTQAFPSWLPVPGRRRHRDAVARIDEVVARVVRDGKPSRSHLMGVLLKHLEGQTSERVSRELRDDAVTMFLTGHETTAQMLTWAVFALGRDPAIQDKLREELSAELSGKAPRFEDLPRLEYSRMVLSESLRKYAPVYWLARTAVADDVIDGFRVAKGQTVVALSHMLHHHPDHWREPERFAPERFSFGESQGRHPLSWVPFGTGQRRCVGQEFAMMEGQLALARVLQRYRLTPVAGKPTTMQVSTTLRPRGGVWMHLSRC